MSLIKIAANAWQKRLISNGQDRLSDAAVKLIHDRGIARTSTQMARGMKKGNMALADKFNATIVHSPKEFAGALKKPDGLASKYWKAARKVGVGESAATIPSRLGFKKTTIVSATGNEFKDNLYFSSRPVRDRPLLRALTNRHEVHEARYINSGNKLLSRNTGHFDFNTHNNTTPILGSGELIGSHKSIGVLARENNDIARLRGYGSAPDTLRAARHITGESAGMRHTVGHNFDHGEHFYSPKEIKRIESIVPPKSSIKQTYKAIRRDGLAKTLFSKGHPVNIHEGHMAIEEEMGKDLLRKHGII